MSSPTFDTKTPTSLAQAMELLRASAGANATVSALTNTIESVADSGRGGELGLMADTILAHAAHSATITQLTQALGEMGVHKVVPMMINATKANIAIALYCGDGIVAKITTRRFLSNALRPRGFEGSALMLPEVLPPLRSKDVGDFSVELFPWIDRNNVNAEDVQAIKKRLKTSNLEFKRGDDRTDNIGLLPGSEHRAAVLDTDAVQKIEGSDPVPTSNIHQWHSEIIKRFEPLYQAEKLVSENPNFEEAYSPLIASQKGKWASSHSPTSKASPNASPSIGAGALGKSSEWKKG
jgi:hypothetical protein